MGQRIPQISTIQSLQEQKERLSLASRESSALIYSEITKSSLYYSNLMYKSIHKSPIQVQLMMPCKYDLYALT